MSVSLIFADCDTHPGRRAGWRCQSCGKALCPACTGERRAGTQMMDVCALCRGAAAPIRERRAVLQPFARLLPKALLWPFLRNGPLVLALWGLLVFVAGAIGGGGIARGLLVAYLFHITRWTSLGNEEIPGANEFRGFFEDVVASGTRLFLATIWVTAPVVLMLWAGETPAEPLFIVVAATLGLAIVPISLLASAVATPLRQILNPLVLGGYAWKLGSDYLLLLVFGAFALLVQYVLTGARGALEGGRVVGLLFSIVEMALPFAFFRALGLLLRARGDDLGYGPERDYLDPVLGQAKPEAGEVGNVAGRGNSEARAEALAGERGIARADGQTLPAPEPIELSAAPEAVHLPVELAQRVRQGDLAGALSLLEQSPAGVPALTLSAEAWLALGQAGAEQKRFPAALVALRRAIEVAPEGQLAPRAWLLAARLYDEGLKDRGQSDKLLGELLLRFPETKEGEFAARRLAASPR